MARLIAADPADAASGAPAEAADPGGTAGTDQAGVTAGGPGANGGAGAAGPGAGDGRGGAPAPRAAGAGEAGGHGEEPYVDELTPAQIVTELDKYIVGQREAKRAVAIALRNRWRRQQVGEDLRDEIMPNNIILIGPTGVGKTEISRRLARLMGAPFLKVEASKFTEVGYVGRDVESIVRDLVDVAVNLVRQEREEDVESRAAELAEERILDLLLPPPSGRGDAASGGTAGAVAAAGPRRDAAMRAAPASGVTAAAGETAGAAGDGADADDEAAAKRRRSREKLRKLLTDGKLEERMIEVEVGSQRMPLFFSPMGFEETDTNVMEMLEEILPKRKKRRRVPVSEARRILLQEEMGKLIDMDDVVSEALERVENHGIVFLDEIDKIVGEHVKTGPDVSREGVQRDLLPIVEGSTVSTRYGMVQTDHVLFIAAGAFHVAKPSDMIPEMQGRFPIRVELESLAAADFERILVEPRNALTKQYEALLGTEGVTLTFTPEGVREIARTAATVNESLENIGARRLHTILTRLLDDALYDPPSDGDRRVVVDAEFVRTRLQKIVQDQDLRRYIL